MKHIILAIISCLIVLSCSDDFDETSDTNQRKITFSIDCSNIFSDVLIQTNSSYTLGATLEIPDSMRLRVSAYCYDSNDSLISKNTALTTDIHKQELTIRHLLKDQIYRFVVIADIVKYDPYIDFYEIWSQLNTLDYNSFYFYSKDKDANPCFNVIRNSKFDAIPDNQVLPVKLEPITYNGYCVFENLKGIDKLSGNLLYPNDFLMSNLYAQKITSHLFSYYSPQTDSVCLPIVTGKTSSELKIQVITNVNNVVDTVATKFLTNNRPFVVRIDCKTRSVKEIKQY